MSSLRTQITLSAVILVALAVGLSGLVIAVRIDHRDRAQVDDQLRARALRVIEDEAKDRASGAGLLGENAGPNRDSTLLAGTDVVTRVLSGVRVVAHRGEGIAESTSVAAEPGLSTVTVDGRSWRSFVRATTAVPEGRLQVLQSLEPVDDRLRANGRLIATIAVLATLATAIAVWLATGLLLRPLERLRTGARSIRPGANQRLPEVHRPQEIAELSDTLNAMLKRLEMSMLATRRFTADAGHELRTPLTGLGMDIETLSGAAELSDEQRAEILSAMTREHRRLVALLDGLQRLARGDAEALPDRTTIDVGDVVANEVGAAARRHPQATFALGDVPDGAIADGWRDGIGLALSNLLDNAALHGRPAGVIDVDVTVADGVVRISVCDDGPGVTREDRARVVERFVRGQTTRSSGSGLGLALVDQQAPLHGGQLRLEESPAGGLQTTLCIPARSS